MPCCGQKRDSLTPQSQSTLPPAVLSNGGRTAVAANDARVVTVRYKESSRIVVEGPSTGRRYEFSGAKAVQSVDARDASALLNTRFFVRA
jgi:hypothetical protein